MPVKPDSRFASLSVLQVAAPDGSTRTVISLPLTRATAAIAARYRVGQGDAVDLLAKRFYGDERLYFRLLDANPSVYPLDIKAGDVLDVPAPGVATRITRARSF